MRGRNPSVRVRLDQDGLPSETSKRRIISRLLKKAHLLRFTHPPRVEHRAGLLRRTSKYALLLRISGALHPGIFEQPEKNHFFSNL
jgi:hypothetical protein